MMSELPDFFKQIMAEREPFDPSRYVNKTGYTQRQWDRMIGIGTVPKKYKLAKKESS